MPSPLTFLKNLTNPKDEHPVPLAAPKGILKRNPAKLKKSVRRVPADQDHHLEKHAHIPAPDSPLGERDENNRDYGFHSSIPNGSVEGWRNFPPPHRLDSVMKKGAGGHPASQPRQSEIDNPIVSRYITTSQTEHPPAKIPEPMPPSRTWSTIPSAQQESSHLRRSSTKKDGTTTAHASFAPTAAGDQSRNSEDFSLLTVGQQSSEHERRYLEYPNTPSAKRANLTYSSNSASQHPDMSTSLQRANTVVTQPNIQRGAGLNYKDEIDSDPEVYHYIVPTGVDVIFQDEDGTEIARTGKTVRTPVRTRPLKSAPIIVHDEFGTFLYQDSLPSGLKGSSNRKGHEGMPRTYYARDERMHGKIGAETSLPSWLLSSPTSLSPRSKIIKIDQEGNQTYLIKPSI